MKGVGAVRNRALCGFASTLWARSVRPQVRQRPHPLSRWPRRAQGSALGIPQGRAVDANGVALMPQATEEGLDERFVPQKPLPFGVVKVECGAYCYAELTSQRPRDSQFLPKDQTML